MPYYLDASCVCLPELGFKCKNCEERDNPENVEKELRRQGYGYIRADQDGYDGEEVSAIEHKSEEFFAAAKELLDAEPLEEKQKI